MAAIEVRGLVKRYPETTAVDGVDLTIEEGEVFCLLGPNGAGKTTTVEILEGHRERTAGSVSVLGFDPAHAPREFRERIGIVLQSTALETILTVREAIDTYGSPYPRRRPAAELIELVGLEAKADARVKTLSGGQRRRLELALGIVGDPDVIFLDEPTTGFDPAARRQAWSVVENLTSLGKTILLTTHYLDEAQRLADRLALIVAGRIISEGTPRTLGGRDAAATVIRFAVPSDRSLPGDLASVATIRDGQVELHTERPTAVLHDLTGWAVSGGFELDGLTVDRPSLEDIYLELAGEDAGV